MKRTTPLRAKPKHKSAAVKRHHARVASLGCLVCGSPAEVHHVTGYADRPGRISRDDWLVTPLCPKHHRVGAVGGFYSSVEALSHRGFFEVYEIDLLAEAERLRDEDLELESDAA